MNKKLAQISAGGPAFAISPGLAIGASPGLTAINGITCGGKVLDINSGTA